MILFGFFRGRPFVRGTRTSASVASARRVSSGEALSSRTPAEDPDRRPVPGSPATGFRRWGRVPSTSSLRHAWFCRLRSPFLTDAKLPSREVSSHCFNRRQQIVGEGYLAGRNRHAAPVRSTHKIPSRQAQCETHGRPRLSRRRFGSGNSGSIYVH